MGEFEPKIVAFLCKWCTSAAADLAGTSRIEYPTSIFPISVPCSGSVDSVYVLKALLEGADGVFLGGCHPGDCHYVSGNYKARRRSALLESVLDTLGLQKERVNLKWISASEGRKFAEVTTKMTEDIRRIGPSPMKMEF